MIDKQVVGGSSLPICEENVVCMIADDIFFQKILYISKICSIFGRCLDYVNSPECTVAPCGIYTIVIF